MTSLENGRPNSGDSGVPVTPTSQSSYKSVTGISIHASDENLQNVSTVDSDQLNFRRWMIDNGLYRSAFHSGRPYQ